MVVTLNSRIIGESFGSPAKALAYVEAKGLLDAYTIGYVNTLYALCKATGIRFELAFGQWCDETDIGRAPLWLDYRNPAGIGKFTDGTYVGLKYVQPEDSARAQLIHLWLYAVGTELPPELSPYVNLDPRWAAAIQLGKAGSAPILSGLAGSWAENPNYAVQIAWHVVSAFGNLPEGATMTEEIVFGRVPKPVYVDKYIPDFEGMAAGWYGPRMILGVVWHRMVGTLEGTNTHFRNPGTGLTDFGVGVGPVDGSGKDGVIYRWNDPVGLRSGWASGVVIAPYGDGLAFLREYQPQYGVDIVNRGQVSIEISGQYGDSLTPASRAAICALTAYYADQAHIPWDQFPMWGNHGYSFVRWHQEFTGPQEKVCPGAVVIAETPNLMELTRALMKKWQLGASAIEPPPVVYTPGTVPDWLKADLAKGIMRDHTWNGTMVRGCSREYKALRETPRRTVASLASTKYAGPPLKAGEAFEGSHRFGDWVLTPWGTRVYAPDLTPEVIIRGRTH